MYPTNFRSLLFVLLVLPQVLTLTSSCGESKEAVPYALEIITTQAVTDAATLKQDLEDLLEPISTTDYNYYATLELGRIGTSAADLIFIKCKYKNEPDFVTCHRK